MKNFLKNYWLIMAGTMFLAGYIVFSLVLSTDAVVLPPSTTVNLYNGCPNMASSNDVNAIVSATNDTSRTEMLATNALLVGKITAATNQITSTSNTLYTTANSASNTLAGATTTAQNNANTASNLAASAFANAGTASNIAVTASNLAASITGYTTNIIGYVSITSSNLWLITNGVIKAIVPQ